jgi:ABC-type dipeptide/oligopeptide/nickel transport system permease subunit
MKKRGIDKGISAAGTILFVGLIQTTAPAWSLVILALLIYEIMQWCCRIARREARKSRRRRYITASRIDAERWAGTWLRYPMKEVS